MTALAPRTLEALVDGVAATSPAPLRITAAATTRPRPARAGDAGAVVLDMRGLSGIGGYDPAECVVTVLAGTPVADVAGALAAAGQYLPWDPPFVDAGATVGGMVATGLSGPGRYRYGGVRDFVIGARVVDGRGRLIASGGQVVKNAAGFLTHHVLVGSAGRLGVIAEVSFKVFPRPEATCTLVASAASLADAIAAHERVRLAALDLDALDLDVTTASVALRVAGAADALAARAVRATAALGLPADRLTGGDEAALWRRLSIAAWPDDGATVKIPATPSRLAMLLPALAPHGACRVSVGGAVVYLHSTGPLEAVDHTLAANGAAGVVVRGTAAGQRLGISHGAAFLDRVTRTLDPDARFR